MKNKTISILDIYDSLPDDEREIIDDDVIYRIKQGKKSIRAFEDIPQELRKYYVAHYGTGMGNKKGKFIGLVCKSCSHWIECGHADDCPVNDILDLLTDSNE